MQKKRNLLLAFVLGLFLISFVSASFHYGYNNFSLSNLLYNLDSSTMILGAIFIIVFAFANFSLSKFFKNKDGEPIKGTAGIVSFVIAFLAIYGINRYGIDYEGFFYSIGFSGDLLFILLPAILLVGAIYILWTYNLAILFLISGVVFTALTIFTDLFYEKGLAFIIGVILILVGLYLPRLGGHLNYRKRLSEQRYAQKLDYKLERQKISDNYKLKR